MKPLSHEERRELEDLLDDLAADCLTPDERLRLNTLLLNNPAAQQMHLDYFSMHAALYRSSASQPTDEDRHAALASAGVNLAIGCDHDSEPRAAGTSESPPMIGSESPSAPQPVLGFLGKATHWARRPVLWSVLGAGVLYAGYVVTISWDMLGKTLPSGTDGNATTVAGITGSLDAIWTTHAESPSALAPDNQGAVSQGETLQIAAGFVELQLRQGTRLVVKGPARWTIDSQNSATLSYGTVVAKVPRAAVGFALSTPNARVVDLGTEFGVVVTQDGGSAVHVLNGTIDWQRKDPSGEMQSRVLRTGQNASVAASGQTMQAHPKLATKLAELAEVQFSTMTGSSAADLSSVTRMVDLSRADASQSSKFERGSYPAANAIDGDPRSFSHTSDSDRAPWWQVDLGQPRKVAAVVLHNRLDSEKARLRDITIRLIGEDGKTIVASSPLLNPGNTEFGGVKDTMQGPAQLSFDVQKSAGKPLEGRYLRVERTTDLHDDHVPTAGHQTYLTLGEVQVFEPLPRNLRKPATNDRDAN